MREMKDSGIEWIGEIPKEWIITKIKNHFKIGSGTTPKSNDPEMWNGDIVWITPADFKTDNVYVEKGHRCLSENGFISSSLELIEPGNIIFSKRAPIGQVVINRTRLCTNQGCLTVVKTDKSDVRYYRYVMSVATEEFELSGSGTTFKEISANTFGNTFLPRPSYYVQKNIADYLDEKCAKIDTIIEKQQEIIEKLKEYKLSVITESVTKGLNPDAEMKDSGIECIGKIPIDWTVNKFKHMSIEIGDGLHGTPDYDSDGDYYFINGQNIGEEELVFTEKTDKINEGEYRKYKQVSISQNTIFITLNGATYGKTSFYNGEKVFLGKSAGYITFKDEENKRFIRYYLQSHAAKTIMDLSLCGSTIANLSLATLNEFCIPLPCEKEQIQIVNFLDKKCSAIEEKIIKKEETINKLSEYKKSIIYEVVTGKREV